MLNVVSGGQTGVDRAALDVAIEKGIPYGGWCPKGGWAEDLPDPPGVLALYPGLRETSDAAPEQRTEWNVRDSDAVMVLTNGERVAVSKGTALALRCAEALGKPLIVIDLDTSQAPVQARDWLGGQPADIVLCIAGPRESEAPGVYVKARKLLQNILK